MQDAPTKLLVVWKYYCNHQKKVALVLTIGSLSVFLQYALLIYIYMATWLKKAYAFEPFKFNSNIYVYPQKSKQARLKQLLGKYPAIFIATFISLLPIWRMLKKVDPITIIEGKV